MKPFQEDITDGCRIRRFSRDIDERELKWHWDEKDRRVTPMAANDWMFQFDNELPFLIKEEINIPAGKIHRIIRGTVDLVVKIEEQKS